MVKLDFFPILTTALSLLLVAFPTAQARQAGLRHAAAAAAAGQDGPAGLGDLMENPFMRRQTQELNRNVAMEQHHPMYRSQPFEQQQQHPGERRQLVGAHGTSSSSIGSSGNTPSQEQEEADQISNPQCTEQIVAVKVSQYNVTYQDWANIQYGQTAIYAAHNMHLKIGTWYWEWIDDIYGTMMIYWNQKESIFFGFHNYQEHYPIAGGWTRDNECPAGYATFLQWVGNDIRQYKLHVCNACPNPNPPISTR